MHSCSSTLFYTLRIANINAIATSVQYWTPIALERHGRREEEYKIDKSKCCKHLVKDWLWMLSSTDCRSFVVYLMTPHMRKWRDCRFIKRASFFKDWYFVAVAVLGFNLSPVEQNWGSINHNLDKVKPQRKYSSISNNLIYLMFCFKPTTSWCCCSGLK